MTSAVDRRIQAIRKTIYSLHQTFGDSQVTIRHSDRRALPANQTMAAEVHIVVVTRGDDHLVETANVDSSLFQHYPIDAKPMELGFRCHRILRDRWGNYDYYCYLEDDLAVQDAWLFQKLAWFNEYVGDQKVLLPNRFEVADDHAYKKCYVDGDLASRVTKPFQDISIEPELQSAVMKKPVRFVRPLNPHSGCFFLNKEQMGHWMAKPGFGEPTSRFIGPLESAATLGMMRTFKVYKPAPENASFLEVQHFGDQYLRKIFKT